MNSIEATKIFDLTLDWDRKRPTPPGESYERPLEVNVLCTSVFGAAKALEPAAALARGLNARVHLVVAQQVSYAVPLESPPTSVDFAERSARKLAESCGVETNVEILLCRDAEEAFRSHLQPRSLVILGARRRWWPCREQRMARHLRQLGHEVLVIHGKGIGRA